MSSSGARSVRVVEGMLWYDLAPRNLVHCQSLSMLKASKRTRPQVGILYRANVMRRNLVTIVDFWGDLKPRK